MLYQPRSAGIGALSPMDASQPPKQEEPFNSFTTMKPVGEMSVWERIKNTLNPFGSALQRQNFNEAVSSAFTPRPAGVGDTDQGFWSRVGENFWPAFTAQQLGGSQPTMGVLPVLPGSGSPVDLDKINLIRERPSNALGGVRNPNYPMGADAYERWSQSNQQAQQEEDQLQTGATIEELLALAEMYRPSADYSAARAQMQEQADAVAAKLQAMYDEYYKQTEENVARVQDIYEGVQQGTGDIYGRAAENVTQASNTAQQQAADQMARLGIEAAAPIVAQPAAASTAAALNALASGRASGEAFAERSGGIGGEFASQMATVAQQQGVEQRQALYNALMAQLAESMANEAAVGADYDPLAAALKIQDITQGLTPDTGDAFKIEQADISVFNDAYARNMERFPGLAGQELERAAYDATMREAATGMFGPRLQEQAIAEGYGVQ